MQNLMVEKFFEGLNNFYDEIVINTNEDYNSEKLKGLIGDVPFNVSCNQEENVFSFEFPDFALKYNSVSSIFEMKKKIQDGEFCYGFSKDNNYHTMTKISDGMI